MIRIKSLAAVSLAVLFLAACGSSGMGDILGGGSQSSQNYEIRGTVDYVDVSSRSIQLVNVSGNNSSMLSGGSSNSVRVYYDDRTPVEYNGQTYRPQDLERGDEVVVRVDESGNSLMAQSMTVVRDVSVGTSPTYPGGTYDSSVRGTVRYVDTSRRTIEVDQGSGTLTTVEYETSTPVYFNNQTYRAADLERGDEIDIRVRSAGTNRWVAEQISVIRSVNGSSSGSSTSVSTLRGTVLYVDTSRRTIELESTSWRSNFKSNTGTSSGRMIVSYDANTSVNVGGQWQAVTGLERGDVVEIEVSNPNAATPFASRIYLIRDVRN